MRKQTSSGMFSADGLCLAICFTIILATLQVSCTNDNFATNSKDQQQVKGYYGLLKDLGKSTRLARLPSAHVVDQLVCPQLFGPFDLSIDINVGVHFPLLLWPLTRAR